MSLEAQLAFPHGVPPMGIYAITCTATGQVYVGQSRRVRGRWRDHVKELRAGRGCPRLQGVWDQHGGAVFTFQVLEEVVDPSLLCSREQHYLDTLNACGPKGLNTLPTAGSFKGYTPNKEARAKIGAATRRRHQADPTLQPRMVAAAKACGYRHSALTRQKISVAQKGVPKGPQSQEHRDAISRALKGKAPLAAIESNRGRPCSESTKKKVGDANRGRKWTAEQYRKRAAYRPSDETLQKMSKARKGVPWTKARRDAHERLKAGGT